MNANHKKQRWCLPTVVIKTAHKEHVVTRPTRLVFGFRILPRTLAVSVCYGWDPQMLFSFTVNSCW